MGATALTSLLGLADQSDDPTPSLVQFIEDKRVLLVLDTCEHLVEAIANLPAAITSGAPNGHTLDISRKAPRIEGSQDMGRALLLPPWNDSRKTMMFSTLRP